MEDCLFCKIIAGEVPSTKVFENDKIYAFRDIAPAAPEHVVMVPKKHICCANAITAENSSCVADICEAVPEIAKAVGVDKDGYRIVNNCGKNGGQTVMHLHFHLLGGKPGGKMY
ncbi:MAG: histidine triad nucleotide-binding protein [Candidatus Ornithomonoglobus sp.]